MSKDEIEARIEQVKRLISKRTGQSGWAANVRVLEATLAELEAALSELD